MEVFSPARPVRTLIVGYVKLIDSQQHHGVAHVLPEREGLQKGLQRTGSLSQGTEHCLELFQLERAVQMCLDTSHHCTLVKSFPWAQDPTEGTFRNWGQMCCRDIADVVAVYLMDKEWEPRGINSELKARGSWQGNWHFPHASVNFMLIKWKNKTSIFLKKPVITKEPFWISAS